MKAPTNDHLRDWHFIVITDPTVVPRVFQGFPQGSPRNGWTLFMKLLEFAG